MGSRRSRSTPRRLETTTETECFANLHVVQGIETATGTRKVTLCKSLMPFGSDSLSRHNLSIEFAYNANSTRFPKDLIKQQLLIKQTRLRKSIPIKATLEIGLYQVLTNPESTTFLFVAKTMEDDFVTIYRSRFQLICERRTLLAYFSWCLSLIW